MEEVRSSILLSSTITCVPLASGRAFCVTHPKPPSGRAFCVTHYGENRREGNPLSPWLLLQVEWSRSSKLEIPLNDPIEQARQRSDQELRDQVRIAIDAAEDRKAEDTQAFFVGEVMGITDWFIVTSGTNPRQVRAIVENIEGELTDQLGIKPLRIEGLDSLAWVLMDFGGFVVHVFHHESREYYNLERLWSDVPRFERQSA